MTTFSLQPFFNELDVLEIKLATLDEYVDCFVIAESPLTYSGDEKPLYFEENRDRFARWAHKIVQVTVTDPPVGTAVRAEPGMPTTACDSDRWVREQHQRDQLSAAVAHCNPDDIIFLSDCDEIPDPARCWHDGIAIAETGLIARPTLAMHVGRLDWRWSQAVPVIARFFTGETLARYGQSVEAVRQSEGHPFGPRDAAGLGWHLAYMGGVDGIQHKLASAAHHELDRPPFSDPQHIQHCLDTGVDLFDRPNRRCHLCPLDQLPPYVQDNPERFLC